MSSIITKSYFLDVAAPSTVAITSPTNSVFSNTGNVVLSWNTATDTGAGLSTTPYIYLVSTNSGFTNIVASGSTAQTTQNIALSDGTYFAKIQARDLAGNTSMSSVTSFTVDTVAPGVPTNVSVNHGNIIDVNTQANVTIIGSG